jgi:hypothetical protein
MDDMEKVQQPAVRLPRVDAQDSGVPWDPIAQKAVTDVRVCLGSPLGAHLCLLRH